MGRIIDKITSERKKSSEAREEESKRSNSNEGEEHNITKGRNVMRYYSFEFFPPKTEAGLDNLLTRIDRMSNRLNPLFVDVTWGDSGCTWARTMAVASHAQRYCGVDVLLHLTCVGMTREQLAEVLQQARRCGVHNVLALRGDPPRGKRGWDHNDVSGGSCDRAVDLVRLIRKLHGDYFGISIAGHPEGHPSSTSLEEEMLDLNEKVNAGADLILTQFFYDAQIFIKYVQNCRAHGITCPILPGIMPIQSYQSFLRMTEFCGITVPQSVVQRLEPVRDDDEAVKKIGCQIAADMCSEILSHPQIDVDGLHFYTLNLERSVNRILFILGTLTASSHSEQNEAQQSIGDNTEKSKENLLSPSPSTSEALLPVTARRQFPWRPSAMESRSKEDVRPINWANRPKSYIRRTDDWDEFPNGRWGDASSPAFGELSDLSHFYSFTLGSEEDRLAMLGHNPTLTSDVYEVFARYVEGKVPHLPWCETPLQPESFTIQKQLAGLNRTGFLTINSQPPVNAGSSSHPVFGWGGAGGYIYQKAYCECFVSPENANRLLAMVSEHPTMNLYAVNSSGHELRVGVEEGGATALTWGVFANREILQPTIFEPATYLVWAEEAFSLWTTMWLNLYEPDSDSYQLIEDIRDTYFLVAIIDNDFIHDQNGGNLWNALLQVGQQI